MSLTGFSTRPFVIRKQIYTEPQILPALPATALSFVITKKIVPPPSGALDETALSTSQTPAPMASVTAPDETDSQNNSAADRLPLPSASLSFTGPWQESDLVSRLMSEADASPSVVSSSSPTSDAASPSADQSREAAFVSAVLDRVAVSPEIVPASKADGRHRFTLCRSTPGKGSAKAGIGHHLQTVPFPSVFASALQLPVPQKRPKCRSRFSKNGTGPIHR